MRFYATFALLVACTVGCGLSPDDARRDLTAIGVDFTSEQFIQSAMTNDRRAVELFLVAGIDVNSVFRVGADSETVRSALSAAIYQGNLDIASALIKAGAEVNGTYSEIVAPHEYDDMDLLNPRYTGNVSYTPLARAVWWMGWSSEFGDRAGSIVARGLIVEMLVEAGADVNGTYVETWRPSAYYAGFGGRSNDTVLTLAALVPDMALMRLLINTGADVNGTSSYRYPRDSPFVSLTEQNDTVLSIAQLQVPAVRESAERGEDLNGLREEDRQKIVDLLIAAGARE